MKGPQLAFDLNSPDVTMEFPAFSTYRFVDGQLVAKPPESSNALSTKRDEPWIQVAPKPPPILGHRQCKMMYSNQLAGAMCRRDSVS